MNGFLSARVFQPLSRLSYCVYLTHYAVLMINTGRYRNAMYGDEYDFVSTAICSPIIEIARSHIYRVECTNGINRGWWRGQWSERGRNGKSECFMRNFKKKMTFQNFAEWYTHFTRPRPLHLPRSLPLQLFPVPLHFPLFIPSVLWSKTFKSQVFLRVQLLHATSDVVVTLVAALALYLLVEAPVLELTKLAFSGHRGQSPSVPALQESTEEELINNMSKHK